MFLCIYHAGDCQQQGRRFLKGAPWGVADFNFIVERQTCGICGVLSNGEQSSCYHILYFFHDKRKTWVRNDILPQHDLEFFFNLIYKMFMLSALRSTAASASSFSTSVPQNVAQVSWSQMVITLGIVSPHVRAFHVLRKCTYISIIRYS